ncbi:hypothetical protein EV121DRAFT_193432 [Schizophyllum commune]
MASPAAAALGNLDSKIGATYLGIIFAAIFYGITSIQAFLYFQRPKEQSDGWKYAVLVGGLWILDTIHLAFVCDAGYHYLIDNYANPVALATANWCVITAQILISSISNFIIRSVYGYRVWSFVRRRLLVGLPVTLLIAATTLVSFDLHNSCGYWFQIPAFSRFDEFSYFMYTALGAGVGVDAMIALALSLSLSQSRTGFKRTDSLVNILMAYTINTSLLTSLCSIACFTTYTIWPHEMTYIGIYFTLSKLYMNSLFATLNGRSAIRDKINNSYGLSNMSGNRGQNSSSNGHVVLNVNKEVETVIRVEQDHMMMARADYSASDVKHEFGPF